MAPPRINASAVASPVSLFAQALEHDEDKTDGQDGNADQKRQAKNFVAAGKHAEGGAGVADVRKIKKSVDERNRVVQRHGAIDDGFGDLIDDNNRRHPSDDNLPFTAHAAAPAFNTVAQRAHTVGWFLSWPT